MTYQFHCKVYYNMPEFISLSAVGTCNEHFQRSTCQSRGVPKWTGEDALWVPGFIQTDKAELGAESWLRGAAPKPPTADADEMDLSFKFEQPF